MDAAACFGVISRLNPRYAHVVCDDEREYRVPYARLTSLDPQPVTSPEAPARTDAALDAIAARARAWMAAPPLEDWSFQFDHATRRAGGAATMIHESSPWRRRMHGRRRRLTLPTPFCMRSPTPWWGRCTAMMRCGRRRCLGARAAVVTTCNWLSWRNGDHGQNNMIANAPGKPLAKTCWKLHYLLVRRG